MHAGTLVLATALLSGCVAEVTLDSTEQTALSARILLPASGTSQTQTVMGTFEQPLGLYVHDTYGYPVEGAVVELITPEAGASASLSDRGIAITDASGLAQVVATAGSLAGQYAVKAQTEGAPPILLVLRNVPSEPATLLHVSGTSQIGTVARPFAHPLVVVVQDRYGNAVPQVSVDFTAPSALATLSAATVLTGSDGRASVAATATSLVGRYEVQARSIGVTVIFVLANELVMPTSDNRDTARIDGNAAVTRW